MEREHIIPSSLYENKKNFYSKNVDTACSECNQFGSDWVFQTVQKKAKHIYSRLKIKHAALLKFKPWSDDDLNDPDIGQSIKDDAKASKTAQDELKVRMDTLLALSTSEKTNEPGT